MSRHSPNQPAEPNFSILGTSGAQNRCLLHAMGLNLLARAQYGSSIERSYLNPLRVKRLLDSKEVYRNFHDLFVAIGEERPDLIRDPSKNNAVNFVELSHSGLTLVKQEEIMGAALKKVLTSVLQDTHQPHYQHRKTHLSQVLLSYFDLWLKGKDNANEPVVNCFAGMDFVKQKFQALKTSGKSESDLRQELEGWWNKDGYDTYTKEIANQDLSLGEESIGVLCDHFKLNFDYISDSLQDADKKTYHFIKSVDQVGPVTITAHHDGKNHWQAALPEAMAESLLSKDSGTNRAHHLLKVGSEAQYLKPLNIDDYIKRYGYNSTSFTLQQKQKAEAYSKSIESQAVFLLGLELLKLPSYDEAKKFVDHYEEAKKLGKSEFEAIGLAIAEYQIKFKDESYWKTALKKVETRLETKERKLLSPNLLPRERKKLERVMNISQKALTAQEGPTAQLLAKRKEQFAAVFAMEASKKDKTIATLNLDDIEHKLRMQNIEAKKRQNIWRTRIESWKKSDEFKAITENAKKLESDPNNQNNIEVESVGVRSIKFKFKKEQMMIHMTRNRDDSYSLAISPMKENQPLMNIEQCFEKCAKLTFQEMQRKGADLKITLSDIRPPNKRQECIRAFKDAGFTVYEKNEPKLVEAPPDPNQKPVSFQVLDSDIPSESTSMGMGA